LWPPQVDQTPTFDGTLPELSHVVVAPTCGGRKSKFWGESWGRNGKLDKTQGKIKKNHVRKLTRGGRKSAKWQKIVKKKRKPGHKHGEIETKTVRTPTCGHRKS
jgi:hypothetical protein